MNGYPNLTVLASLALLVQVLAVTRAASTTDEILSEPRWAKPRVIVETDIGGDPDDRASLVRLLHHLSDFELVGLLTTRPTGDRRLPKGFHTGLDVAKFHVDRYGEVVGNLKVHHPDFPSYQELLALLKDGQIASRDGVELVKREIHKKDPRPLMFTNWGDDIGAASESSLNRALNELKQENQEAEYRQLASRVHYVGAGWQNHIYDHRTIVGQYTDAFNPKWQEQGGNWYARWKPVTMDQFPNGVRQDIVSGHNVLSASYDHGQNPNLQKEGDTLTYLQFLVNGLNVPGEPWLGGWSGRFKRCGGENANVPCPGSYPKGIWWWNDALDSWNGSTSRDNTLARWASHIQNDFAARADWASTSDYRSVNHHPEITLNGSRGFERLQIRGRPGEPIRLDASGSTDPDRDSLAYEWIIYREISAHGGAFSVETPAIAIFEIPKTASLGDLYEVVLVVTDDGTGLTGDRNPLTRYKRAVIEVVN